MNASEVIEVVALVTGLIYLFLEIIQSNWMWVVGIFTGIPVAISFGLQHVWASMTLNIYYVVMSVVGIMMWIKASRQTSPEAYHLVRLPQKVLIISCVAAIVGIPALIFLLHWTRGQETALDAVAFVLGVIGTWWLAKSYLEQWLIWIVADVFTTVLCISAGSWMLAALYAAYASWAVFGYFLWKKKGEFIA